MRVLLDTNVILDSVLQRNPRHAEANAILKAATHGQLTCAAAPTSLATVFYVARKAKGASVARSAVGRSIAGFEIVPLDKQTLLAADKLPGADFEDNILIAAAVAAAVDGIVTRNKAHFSASPIPVWAPSELLQKLAAGGPPPTPNSGPAVAP